MKTLTCFKAYDIRGQLGVELNEEIAYRIGFAYALVVKPARVALGADIRLSSETLKLALARGLMDAGVDVIDLGMTGTEEVYFAAQHLDIDGAIEVTASHNPIDYNGMKLVRRGAIPISGDSGLKDIQYLAQANDFKPAKVKGSMSRTCILEPYVSHLLSYIDGVNLRPLHILTNAGNGAAGHVIDAIEAEFNKANVPVTFTKIHHHPDGTFPHGIPNPLLPENRSVTQQAVLEHQADIGIAWDGDFDRCFVFDEQGSCIEGYYIVGLLAQMFLNQSSGEKIIYDPRLTWNTQDIVEQFHGIGIQSKTGHAFIKERMRQENAIYGGEMSAHHYFRDFAYCDSGMIPWLLVITLMTKTGKPLSALVKERVAKFPSSGEINRTLKDPKLAIDSLLKTYGEEALNIDRTDGISISFSDWRFNLRCSNTEPLIRLNVETRANSALLQEKTSELLMALAAFE